MPLLKLRDFQDLGHQIIFLVGNATGVVGDTSDKDAERPMLTPEDVEENMRLYVEQAGKIIDIEKAEIVYNADWLNNLGYAEIGHHADAFSLHEFTQRENIKKRLDAGKRVSLRELLYPLMQGYDSVELRADVEVGGTDQRFNLLAGRVLQEQAGQKPQNVVMGNLIIGTDGRKMSSSWGNTIKLTDTAREMSEKIMNMPDEVVSVYFEHCTRTPQDTISEIMAHDDPRMHKIRLAKEVICFYFDSKTAEEEESYLQAKFIDKTLDSAELDTVTCEQQQSIVDVMVGAGFAQSKSDARRKIEQGGVSLADEKITDVNFVLSQAHNDKILKVGKKLTARLVVTS